MSGPAFTPGELEVLWLLVAGHSNKGIGTALGISKGTGRTHVANILAKLQTRIARRLPRSLSGAA